MASNLETLKSEALSAASAAMQAGLNQIQIANSIGVSQSQVSRVLSGKSIRRSKTFENICKYAYESLNKAQGKDKPSAAKNLDLIAALDSVWDGSDQHAKALAVVIHSLGGLDARKAPKAQTRNTRSSTKQKSAR